MPTASNYFHQALHYVFPGKCFEEIVVRFNFAHEKCFPLVLSRLLGIAITVGSSFLLVPQILKIYTAKSGRGISLWAQVLGLLAAAGNASYNYEKGYVFGQWGDTLFVAIQMIFIIMQILWYSDAQPYALAFMAWCWCASLAVFYHFVPMAVLEAIQLSSVPIVFISKSIQVTQNYREQSTGQLSIISVSMQFGGCMARIFTTIQEAGGEWLILLPYIVAAVLNGIILAQILYYGGEPLTVQKKAKKKTH
ncbi:PQ loop repeat domain-containing protein [Ditylenchus destructor]|nr:PQ loop repeat domain-containing protein [Ditylenchus destructor]